MAGDARALVKAARKAGLREGPKGVGDATTLHDGDRLVWQGNVENAALLRNALRDLRKLGYKV